MPVSNCAPAFLIATLFFNLVFFDSAILLKVEIIVFSIPTSESICFEYCSHREKVGSESEMLIALVHSNVLFGDALNNRACNGARVF
jgi:hypothetical protein